MVREAEERAATCVVKALEGQSVPWVLQQKLIHNVAEEIGAAIAAERKSMAEFLDLDEASEESLARLRELAGKMKASKPAKQDTRKVAAG